jgi:hypothetical protein
MMAYGMGGEVRKALEAVEKQSSTDIHTSPHKSHTTATP